MAAALSLIPNFIWQQIDDSGKPAAGAKIYTWESGTTTPKAVYKDYEGTILWTDPVILNAYGRATIFGSGVYSVRVLAADDSVIIDKIDGVVFSLTGDTTSTISVVANYAAVRALTTIPDQIYVQGRLTAGDGGQGLFASVSSGTDNDGTLLVANSGSAYYSRIYDGILDPRWFGVAYAKSASQYTPMLSALTASAALGEPLTLSSSVTSAQDITVPSGACLSFGEGGDISGSVAITLKLSTGSRFIGARNCIGANVTLQANVGCCDYINPNWFLGSDTYKLNAAGQSVAAASLALGNMTGAGWGEGASNTEYHHAPGDSTYGVLPVNSMISAKRYMASFDVTRPDQTQYICSNNIVSTGWDGSWLTGYTHRSSNGGNTNVLSVTTTAKIDATHAYAFEATISGMSKGALQISLGTTTIGTYSVNGDIVSSIIFSADNPNVNFAPSADFDGTVTGISLTKASSVLADAIQQMTLVSTGWTGTKDALTHTAGNTTPATFTLSNPLPVGTHINGSFTINRSAVQPELISTATWSNVGWSGTLAGASYCHRFTMANNTPTYITDGAPAPTDQDVYNQYYYFYPTPPINIYNKLAGTLTGLDNNNVYTITFTVANMTEGGVELLANGECNMYFANGTYTYNVKPINGELVVSAVGASLRGNSTNNYIGPQRAFNGTVQASVKVANPGSFVVAADGHTVVLNNDPTAVAKNTGLYAFSVVTTGTLSNTLVFTPTSEFDGTISGLTYTIEHPGVCDVYAGGYATGTQITKDGHYSVVFNGSSTNNNVTFRPSTSFYGNISNIVVVEDSAVMPVKLTDTYSVSGAIALPYLDPWGGIIIWNAAGTLSLSGIIDNRALPYVGGAQYLTSVNLGSALAYPEHAGAIGSGTSDDYAGIQYALLAGTASLSGIYEIDTSITIPNAITLAGPNSTKPAINSTGRLVINQGVTLSTGFVAADGVVIDVLGSLTVEGMDYRNSYLALEYGASITVASTFTGYNSVLNLWTGLQNVGIADIEAVDLESANTVSYIAPLNNLSRARNCTVTGFGGIPTAAVASVSDCDFNSPKSVGLIVPANGTLLVNRCTKKCALFVASGLSSTTYVYNTPSFDCCNSTNGMLSYSDDTSLLHDGVGAIITDEVPRRSTNPVLPRTRMGSSVYGTYPFTVIPDLIMTAGQWLFGPRMPNIISYKDNMVPDNETDPMWKTQGSACLVNAPNDDAIRSAYYQWPYLDYENLIDADGMDICRLMWGNVVTLTIAPPSGGFAKGASLRLTDGYHVWNYDPNTDEATNTGYSQDVYYVRDRTIDLPIGTTSTINVTLPAITGLACGRATGIPRSGYSASDTDGKQIAMGRQAFGTPFGILISNLNGASITCKMSLQLPDDNSVDMFAHTATERKAFSLLSVSSSPYQNLHVATWDIINSRIIRIQLLGSESNMTNNGALGSIIKSNWNAAHYNWAMNDNGQGGFAWVNMTDGTNIKHEVRTN